MDAIGCTSIYGGYIVKFVLKGGFKDFLIFDKDFNQRHGTGESIKDQLKRIAPEILDYMQKNFDRRTYNYVIHWSGDSMRAPGGVRGNDRGFRSAGQVRAFLGTPVNYRQKGDCYVPDSMLKASNIRGYIFRGSGDGRVVVVRNFTDVMPVAWTTAKDAEAYFNGDRKRNIWRQINQKSFEKLNQKHDANTRILTRGNLTVLVLCAYRKVVNIILSTQTRIKRFSRLTLTMRQTSVLPLVRRPLRYLVTNTHSILIWIKSSLLKRMRWTLQLCLLESLSTLSSRRHRVVLKNS